MSKNKTAPPQLTDPVTIRVELEDWILIEGGARGLRNLATQIRGVAMGKLPSLTMDHPGPYLAENSTYGIIVVRRGKATRRQRGNRRANPTDK